MASEMAALTISGIGDDKMKNVKKIISYLKVYTQPNYQPGMRMKTFSDIQVLKNICLLLIPFQKFLEVCHHEGKSGERKAWHRGNG